MYHSIFSFSPNSTPPQRRMGETVNLYWFIVPTKNYRNMYAKNRISKFASVLYLSDRYTDRDNELIKGFHPLITRCLTNIT